MRRGAGDAPTLPPQWLLHRSTGSTQHRPPSTLILVPVAHPSPRLLCAQGVLDDKYRALLGTSYEKFFPASPSES